MPGSRFLLAPAALCLLAIAALPARRAAIDPYGVGPGAPPGSACDDPAHRQFDFWVGSWEVVTGAGGPAGASVVGRALAGCAVEEHWNGGGNRGRSLNAYDPSDGKWHQHWVAAGGGPGAVTHFAGKLLRGRMVLGGVRTYGSGLRIQDLGVWTAHSADSVQQEFYTVFSDTTSPMSFDGRYRRRASPAWPPDRASTGCAGRASSRAMDFTLGSWDVYANDPGGAGKEPDGRSEIAPDLGHCLLIERYAATRVPGHEALAYAAYSPVSQGWERTQTNTRGLRVFLSAGSLENGRMVMRGRAGRDSLRVTWEPVSAREFRQRWETSADGKAWGTAALVVYAKR